MDFNLIISAQPLILAPKLRTTPTANGLMVVKNVPAKTYLQVTPAQWEILRLFEDVQVVPAVLDRAIRDRLCPPLGEFYELILKAARAGILIPPDQTLPTIESSDWRGAINPQSLARPLALLLIAGIVLSLGFAPAYPSTWMDVAMGLLILCVTVSLAEYLRACLIHGAGGKVYLPRWHWRPLPPGFKIDACDVVMLPRHLQDVIAIVEPALMAAAAGITTWNRPEWSFVPLLGLMLNLRPIIGGQFPSVVRIGREHPQSDSEHAFIFPPNRTPRARWRMLSRGVRQANTWVRFFYGVVWTLAVVYLAARLNETPPWSLAFWEENGVTVGVAIAGSLLLLGLGYATWETIEIIRVRGRSSFDGFRKWWGRWLGRGSRKLDEAGRLDAIAGAPLLRPLDPAERKQLAQAMEPARFGPWRSLSAFEGETAARVALIVSGRIAVRREDARKRKRLVQMLGPGEIIGLHDVADPNGGKYRFRTSTPVTLLTADRAKTSEMIFGRITGAPFGNAVLKVPFLRGISLCRNWHQQAVERFAMLSTLTSHPDASVIFSEGQLVDRFFVLFEGDAVVSKEKRELAVIQAGDFFGEIGLLQNGVASATVTARRATRCLSIARADFLRFVTHNYSVALELERVSSSRLGRPIFPVKQRDLVAH